MHLKRILAAVVCSASLTGCGDFFAEGPGNKPGTPSQPGGSGNGIKAPDGNLPVASTKSIVQLRDPKSADYQAPCAGDQGCPRYRLEKVVVTSETFVIDRDKTTKKPYLFGFFVADPKAVDTEGRLLAYSGMQVAVAPGAKTIQVEGYTFGRQENAFAEPGKVKYEGFPRPGDVVVLEGESKSYFGMPQLTKVGKIEKLPSAADVKTPLPARFDARQSGSLKGGHPAANVKGVAISEVKPHQDAASWAGTLVELVDVDMTKACEPSPFPFKAPTQLRDYGYFQVSGDVEIGTLFGSILGGYWKNVREATSQTCENLQNKCEDSRKAGQHFDSLIGVVDYSYGVYRVNPRNKNDFKPQSLFVGAGTGNCQAPQ
jgi:hypothetical protein